MKHTVTESGKIELQPDECVARVRDPALRTGGLTREEIISELSRTGHVHAPAPEKPRMDGKESALRSEIRSAINRHSRENASDSPDFILAHYLLKCLEAFNEATNARDKWHGFNQRTPLDPPAACVNPDEQPKPL